MACATCLCKSGTAGLAPGGSQTVVIASMVSMTSIVVVMVTSCRFSKGMAEDKTKRAPKVSFVDSFMALDVIMVLDIEIIQDQNQWLMSVVNRLAIVF